MTPEQAQRIRERNTEIVFNILKPEEDGRWVITRSQMMELFAKTKKKPIPPVKPSSEIYITPYHSKFISKRGITTVGSFILNKVVLEDLEILGYYNGPMDGKVVGKLYGVLEHALLNDVITTEKCARFINSMEFLFGGPLSHIINPSIPESALQIHPKVRKRRDELLRVNKAALEAGDEKIAASIEKELVDMTINIMKEENDPALDLYLSGCGLSMSNNYKTMFIMKGPVLDNTDPTGVKYHVVTSNLDDGISKKDFVAMADSGVTNAYSVGIATGDSGYYTKKYNALYQDITLLPQGSDCNTKKTVPIKITEENKKIWGNYRYFVDRDGKIQSLNPDNVSQYVGKTLNMRSPLVCEAEKNHYCNKCYGDLSYKLGKLNVGKTYSVIPNTMMNASLKKKHDTTIYMKPIKIEEIKGFFEK